MDTVQQWPFVNSNLGTQPAILSKNYDELDDHSMTPDSITAITDGWKDDNVEEVAELMADRQVRRIPVLDDYDQLVGIVSLGDLAVTDQDQAGEAMSGISERRHDEPAPHKLLPSVN